MSNAIQQNIKKQLAQKNMTAAELERRTGIPHAVVNIIHGRSKNPSLRTAQAIAQELGCTVEELFAEQPAQQSQALGNGGFDINLYKKACNAVCTEIQKSNLQPRPEQVAACLTETYNYAFGSQTQTIDQRFVAWLVNKDLN